MYQLTRHKKWFWLLPLVLLCSLFFVSTVYAQDEITPDATPTVIEEAAVKEEVPVVAAPALELESPSETEVVITEDIPMEESGVVPEAVQEDEVPAGEVAVITPVKAIADSDPYFKVGTITYAFKLTGTCPGNTATYICTESANPLTAAIQYLMDHPAMVPTDRKVYVEKGDYTGVTIEGSAYANLRQLNGLIGLDGSGDTNINGNLIIDSPLNGFTLSGFTINGSLTIDNALGTIKLTDVHVFNDGGDGIYVETTGSIELTDVESSNNAGRGAELYAYGPASNYVKIINCEFDDNDVGAGKAGLAIDTLGTITLNGVSASRNSGDGADIFNFKSLTISNSLFNDNYVDGAPGSSGYGLNIESDSVSPVTMTNVIASGNENDNLTLITYGNVTGTNVEARWSQKGSGMFIDSSGSAAPATVTINNGQFSENHLDGLHVECKGNISLNNIIANQNTTGDGMYLDNCQYGGSACAGTGGVTLSAVWIADMLNEFYDNGGYGVEVFSKGSVTLSNLDAYENFNGGVYVRNDYGTGNATVNTTYIGSWYNWLGNNEGDTGLLILSGGNILVEYVAADNNAKHGMDLENDNATSPRTIQVKNSEANGNQGDGLHILASGAITLQNLWYIGSNGQSGDGSGASILNESGNVTITGTAIDNPIYFNDNHDYGLYIVSNGSVAVSKIEAVNNGTMGFYVDVTNLPGKTVGITNGRFNDNDSSGLEVYAKGNITLNTVEATNNDNYGAFLDNCLQVGSTGVCLGTGTVTVNAPISFTNNFNENVNDGLHIESKGNISLTNIAANHNYEGFGAYLRNSFTGSAGTMTITATTDQFNYFSSYNAKAGLVVDSFGNISLTKVNACENYGRGAELYNDLAPTPKTVMVTNGIFNDNNNDGLLILSKGAVTLSGVMAHRDSIHDDWLDVAGITVHEYLIEGYWSDEGWYYWTPDRWSFQATSGGGTVKISLECDDFMPQIYVYDADGNQVAGSDNDLEENSLLIEFESDADAFYTIEVTQRWGSGGNYILSLNDLEYGNEWEPDVNGIEVDTTRGTGGVTVNNLAAVGFGVNAYDNSVDGLRIDSRGNTTLNKVDSYRNGRRGLSVDLTGSSTASMTLNTAHLDNNWVVGLVVNANGPMTWNNGSANGNVKEGCAGMMSWSGSPLASVTVANVDFNHTNGAPSLFIYTGGTVTLTNINAINNPTSVGVMILNQAGAAPVTITCSGGKVCEFSDNDKGLAITSRGAITLNGLLVINNGIGATVDNAGALSPMSVSISNSTFNYNNSGTGLEVNSLGNITLNNVEANGNSLHDTFMDLSEHGQSQYEHLGYYNDNDRYWFDGSDGVKVVVELDSDDFEPYFRIFDSNWNFITEAGSGGGSNATLEFTPEWDGTFIVEVSGGNGFYDLSLNDSEDTYRNYFYESSGVWLDNCQYDSDLHACIGSGTVTINNATFRNFSGNNAFGIYIATKGNVSVTNANASTNGGSGLYSNNSFGAGTVMVKSTIPGQYSGFHQNWGNGVDIRSGGAVTLNAVAGNGNVYDGFYLENPAPSILAPLTILNARFWSNGSSGVYAMVFGAVNLTDLRVYSNGDYGVYITNKDASTPQPVNVKKVILRGNGSNGLYVESKGAITIDNINASDNGNHGASLNNNYSGATGGITIASTLGESHFDNNAGNGLEAFSNKSISGSKIYAKENGQIGILADNDSGAGTVSFTTVNVQYNRDEGLKIMANGQVTLNGITALRNGSNSDADGVHVETRSNSISLANSIAQGNHGCGFYLGNVYPNWPTLGTNIYMGNDVDNSGDPNMLIKYLGL
jgi:putative surface-exposed virulence protein